MNIKALASGILRSGASIALMAVLIYLMRDSLPGMMNTIGRTSLFFFALSAVMYILSILLSSIRLRVFLHLQGIKMRTRDVFRVNLIGYFFSSFLPTSIGGDIVKAFYISRESKKNTQSYISIFLDRFVGMFTIVLIATVAVFAVKDTSGLHLVWLLPALIALNLLFIVVLLNKNFTKKFLPLVNFFIPSKFTNEMKNFYNAMRGYRQHRREMAECFLISLAGQIIAFAAVYFLALGIKSYISLKVALLVMPVASIISMLPSINGMGPREMSIVIMLKPFIGASAAGAIAFLWLGLLLLTSVVGGIVYMLTGHYRINIATLAE